MIQKIITEMVSTILEAVALCTFLGACILLAYGVMGG